MATVRRNISISKEQDAFLRKHNISLSKMVQQMIDDTYDDLVFAMRTEEAWKRYEKGEFKTMEFDDFIKEMKTW